MRTRVCVCVFVCARALVEKECHIIFVLWGNFQFFRWTQHFIKKSLEYIRGAFNKFPDFFVQSFKIVVDSWKFSMLLLYILWDDWPICMIPGSNQQLQQQLEYTQLKPDCYSWWISKMQSAREDTLEERYAIRLRFKLGKNATEMYGMLQTAFRPSCINRASDFERQGVCEGLWEVWEE